MDKKDLFSFGSRLLKIVMIFCLLSSRIATSETVGILGDSISTGAASHPGLTFDADVLWHRLSGKEFSNGEWESEIQARQTFDYTRVDPIVNEYRGAFEWVGKNLLFGTMARFFDFPELSWVATYAKKRVPSPRRILIAARDGARIKDFRSQIRRVIRANDDKLPEQLIVFFTGNDVCGPSLGMMTTAEEFGKQLRSGLELIEDVSRDSKVRIFIPTYLSIQQVVQSDVILQKEVRAHGRVLTCKELQTLPPQKWKSTQSEFGYNVAELLSMVNFPQNPRMFCPNLFGANFDNAGKEQIFAITGRMRAFRLEMRRVVEDYQLKLQKQKRSDIEVHYIDGTEAVRFDAGDIGNDCFHLSSSGHEKIGETIAEFIQKVSDG